MHDLVHHFVEPETRARRCSYVEQVARGPQRPQWAVLHSWGDPVLDFIACVTQHAQDHTAPRRQLAKPTASSLSYGFDDEKNETYETVFPPADESTTYWIRAFAVNQHELSAEADPSQANSAEAVEAAGGRVLSVLDVRGGAFSRLWYCLELSLGHGKTTNEFYTTTADFPKPNPRGGAPERLAVGLTAGPCEADLHAGAVVEQTRRQMDFPLELIQRAFEVSVQAAEASETTDRTHILNYIAGRRGGFLDKIPPEACPEYDEVSAKLAGLFAAYAWRLLLASGADMDECARRLEASRLLSLTLDFSDCELQTDGTLALLSSGLPSTLEELRLNGLKGGKATYEGCRALLDGLETRLELHRLTLLDLTQCGLTGSFPGWIGECTSLVELRLEHNKLSGPIPESIGQCAALQVLELRHNSLTGSIPEALGRCLELREVSLHRNSLAGSVPERLGLCTKLSWLSVRDNPALVPILPKALKQRQEVGSFRLDVHSGFG